MGPRRPEVYRMARKRRNACQRTAWASRNMRTGSPSTERKSSVLPEIPAENKEWRRRYWFINIKVEDNAVADVVTAKSAITSVKARHANQYVNDDRCPEDDKIITATSTASRRLQQCASKKLIGPFAWLAHPARRFTATLAPGEHRIHSAMAGISQDLLSAETLHCAHAFKRRRMKTNVSTVARTCLPAL